MRRALAPLLRLVLALLGAFAGAACSGDGAVVPCATADDCSTPFLCCTAGIAVEVEGGAHCVIPDPSLAFCDSYLPHLVEGNPCGRVPLPEAGAATVGAGYDPPPPEADQCREGLTCCATTLACAPNDGCPAAEEVPADATSSGRACHADDECSAPEICCGISYFDRDGSCSLVRDCAVAPSP